MRIAHVSDCYLPRLGGIEMQVHHLAKRQRAAGDAAEVITATPPARHDRTRFEIVDGVPVHRLTVDLPFELPVHPRPGREVGALLRAAAQDGEPYDAAHVHAGLLSPFAYGAIPALLAARVPTLLTVHSMWGPARGVFRAADLAMHWSRWPIVFSAVSEVAAQPVRAVAGAWAEVRVIPNGIDPAHWRLEPLPRVDDDVLLACVMRLAPRKRCIPLLRMLRRARAAVPARIRLRAVVVGEGPEHAAMARYLHRHAMGDWVELVGRWDRAQIQDLYRRADLFVAPSELESFGIAALEARTAGLPVVAKARTGVAEFVRDGVEGVLVDTDDDLVAALADLLTDSGRRRSIAAHNRAVPPNTTWDDVLRRCTAAYTAAGALLSS